MSWQAQAWAMKQTVGGPAGKLILLALANYADDAGSCFPSVARLAVECECTKRTVFTWLETLEKMGLISRENRSRDNGSNSTSRYTLALEITADPQKPDGEKISSGGENFAPPLVKPLHGDGEIISPPEPTTYPSSLPKDLFGESSEVEKETDLTSQASVQTRERARGNGFEAFWELYPNKVGKAAAKVEYDKALKRVSFDELMEGLRRYVAKTDDRPWCNPSTWLHQDRWTDRPAQAPPPRRLNRIEQLEDDLRRRIQNGEGSGEREPDFEADERLPRLALGYHGGRN